MSGFAQRFARFPVLFCLFQLGEFGFVVVLVESPRVDQREQGTGNRNGGCRVDYEIVHVVPAAPFLNECHCGASIALKDM